MLRGKTSVILADVYQMRQSSWALCSSICCSVSSLLPQEPESWRDGDTSCAAGIRKGSECLGTASLAKGR